MRHKISLFLLGLLVSSLALADGPRVLLKTTQGDITVELNPEKAPQSTQNFLGYVQSGHYDGTVFHRVINRFMIQGGGLTGEMVEKPTGKPIRNEASNGLKNERYALAMARTSDPHSATSQFFINVADNAFLNPHGPEAGYAVFGKVVAGQDVVDRISRVRTGVKAGHADVPLAPVVIEKAVALKHQHP